MKCTSRTKAREWSLGPLRCEVVLVDRFNRVDWGIQVGRVREATQRYNRALVQVDSTGAGEPVFEQLRRSGISARAYPFTQKSKAALIDNLAILFEKKRITLPRPELWPEGIDELESFEYSVTDAGNVRTGCPTGMHDDCVISLALGAWIPGRRDSNAKVNRDVLLRAFGRMPRPRRASFRLG